MTKIFLKPLKDQNTLEIFKNDQNTHRNLKMIKISLKPHKLPKYHCHLKKMPKISINL